MRMRATGALALAIGISALGNDQARAAVVFFEYNSVVTITSALAPDNVIVNGPESPQFPFPSPPNPPSLQNVATVSAPPGPATGATFTITSQALTGDQTAVPHLSSGLSGTTLDLGVGSLDNLVSVSEHFDFTFSIALNIVDYPNQNGGPSDGTGSFDITGTIVGDYSSTSQTTNISDYTIQSPSTLTIGGSQYELSNPQFTAPTASVHGGFTADLNRAAPAPEPSSFLLFGMAVSGLGFARWRKRKQAA